MQQDISQRRKVDLTNEYEQDLTIDCQFKVINITNGTFHSRIDINKHNLQQDRFISSRVMTIMADKTAGYAGCTTVDRSVRVLTTEFKIIFFKPASGYALECISSVIRRGRQTIVVESNIIDIQSDERINVAKAMVTLMTLPKEK